MKLWQAFNLAVLIYLVWFMFPLIYLFGDIIKMYGEALKRIDEMIKNEMP